MKYTPARKQKDEAIIKYIEIRGMNLISPSANLEDKLTFLIKEMGYKHLRIGSNKSTCMWRPIRKCSDSRINEVVRRTYQDAKDRLSKYKGLDFYVQGDLFRGQK